MKIKETQCELMLIRTEKSYQILIVRKLFIIEQKDAKIKAFLR